MKMFDLHNDALTCGGKADKRDTIYAVWTTKLSVLSVETLIRNNGDKMLAVEDCEKAEYIDLPSNIEYCGLTWNDFNGLAGGAYSEEGLTDRGKEFITRLNEKSIPLDVAHLNRRSFFEVAERADKIICSHTCFCEVKDHPRNLTREQISVIIQKGGIVGLCFVVEFLGGNTIDDVVRQIDWFVSTFGDGQLCIGSDFYGTTSLPKGLGSYDETERLAVNLAKRGYSDRAIRNIFYDNAASYFIHRGSQ